MKKIMFCFLLLFLFNIKINALTDTFYLGEKVPNMHIESVDATNIHNGIPFILRRSDKEIVYCINPFDKLNTSNYYTAYNYNATIFNLTNEQLNKMNLIAYYGYGYLNHTDIKWYGITQFLIWKTLNLTDIYFTDTYNGNRIQVYEEEIKELENLVNNYYVLPSFSNNNYEYNAYSNYKITDTNYVLNKYEILESNIDAVITDNSLYINTKDDGNYQIKFIKHSPIKKDYILYGLNNYQSLLYPGKIDDITFTINIEVNSGSITINKIDSENKERIEAVLEGAIYGLYDSNELITTIETNEEGIGYIDNLPLGKYYVKEITPSIGYNLDENIYEIDLTKDNKDVIINSYEEVIKGNLIINKYYGDEDDFKLEEGAVFELYDINDNLIDTYHTSNGVINEKLEYGDYYMIQTKGIENHKLVDKFNISIKDNIDYINDLYNIREEVLIVEVPDTFKIDYKKFISPILIIIGSIIVLISRIKYKSKKYIRL